MRHIKFLAILLLLSSCVEVEFKHPMPQKGTTLEKLPEDIKAYLISLDENSTKNSKLTVSEFNEDFDMNKPLPDDVILKKWKGNYYLNQKEDSLWQLIVIKPAKNKTFNITHIDGSNQEIIDKLKSITEVEEIFDADGDLDRIILDPSAKEFKKMLKSSVFVKVDLFED